MQGFLGSWKDLASTWSEMEPQDTVLSSRVGVESSGAPGHETVGSKSQEQPVEMWSPGCG